MAAIFQFPYLVGFPLLPARRLIAVDAGSHSIKILLAEKVGQRLRVLNSRIINLHEEGLLSSEEIGPALERIFDEWGNYPVALALPRQLPLAHILDLQAGSSKTVKQMIEAETSKHRDLRDNAVLYDCARLEPFGRHQNSFLVTLCKESDIFQQIGRLLLPAEDICEVVSSSNVLAKAYASLGRPADRAALVDIGASGTAVTLFINGQAIHATTFPIGGNLITETIASQNNISVENAESLKQKKNLLSGEDAIPAVAKIVEAWRNELEKSVKEWLRENPAMKLAVSDFRFVLSGGASVQPGLLKFLNDNGEQEYTTWPTGADLVVNLPEQFAIAYGTALQALTTTPESASLLPEPLRDSWSKRRIQQFLLTGSFAVLCATLLLLLIGTVEKISVAEKKKTLQANAKIALERAESTKMLRTELARKYEWVRPVMKRQQQTLDTLSALSVLEQSRGSRNLWYVLFADHQSYFTRPTINTYSSRNPAPIVTNAPALRSGFVAELCLNQEGEPMRQTLAQVVAELKQSKLFSNVDTVPSDLRRDFAKTNVIIPDRHFALALELASDDFVPVEKVSTNTPASLPAARSGQGGTIQ